METTISMTEETPTKTCTGENGCGEIKVYTEFNKNPRINLHDPVPKLRCRANQCKKCQQAMAKARRDSIYDPSPLSPLLESWKRA